MSGGVILSHEHNFLVSRSFSFQPSPLDLIIQAPKVLLHDHLDGGLRPQTVLDLAQEFGYADLPASDADSLGRWFSEAAFSGSLQ